MSSARGSWAPGLGPRLGRLKLARAAMGNDPPGVGNAPSKSLQGNHTADGRNPFRTTVQNPWNDAIPPQMPTNNGFNHGFISWCEMDFVHPQGGKGHLLSSKQRRLWTWPTCEQLNLARSSSKEVRIRVPTCFLSILLGEPNLPPKKGENLVGEVPPPRLGSLGANFGSSRSPLLVG